MIPQCGQPQTRVIDTIFGVLGLCLIVTIPAQPRNPGSPLALAFLFIRPFLTDWDRHKIQWSLSVEAHPCQRHTIIEIDITIYPKALPRSESESETSLILFMCSSRILVGVIGNSIDILLGLLITLEV
jgi:hypothetical protein